LRVEFGHVLTVYLGEFQPPSRFSDVFNGQMDTLRKIEDVDGMSDDVHGQVALSFSFFYTVL
jgi:hypothetical protein